MVQLRDPALADDGADGGRGAAARAVRRARRAAVDQRPARPGAARRGRRRARGPGRHAGRPARELVGPSCSIGLSTHSPTSSTRASTAGADQLSVGPVWETPTKPGRPAAGLELRAPRRARRPPGAVVRHRRDRRATTRARWPRRAPSGWWWCGRSATRTTRAPRPRQLQGRAGRRQGWRSAVAASGASSASARRGRTRPRAEPTAEPRARSQGHHGPRLRPRAGQGRRGAGGAEAAGRRASARGR